METGNNLKRNDQMINGIKENMKIVIVAVCTILMILLLAVIFTGSGSGRRKLNGLLDLGQKYLEDMAYEDAILVFDEVITIDPKCAQAFLGKAQAQYALGQAEEAVSTLREGIKQIDESTELRMFLQQILEEMSETLVEKKEAVVEKAEISLLLNYKRIVRRTNTEEPKIQLEVMGSTKPENYIWKSSDPNIATVSESGVVTCMPVAGYADITAEDREGRSDSCLIVIEDTEDVSEYEDIRFRMDGRELFDECYLTATLDHDTEGEGLEIIPTCIGDSEVQEMVYFSGDVSIPERLRYKGLEMPVTSINSFTFYWSAGMKSISIPATVKELNSDQNPFYYCGELEKIIVDGNSSFYKSVDGVLYSKDGKELISYPAAKSNSSYTLPGGVEEIYPGAFTACKNLKEILVEDDNQNYKSINGMLVDDENTLVAYPIGRKESHVVIPETVTQLGIHSFYMSEVEEVVCKSVERISGEVFAECRKLRKIEGGSATKEISIYGEDTVIEIAGIDEMNNLESLSLAAGTKTGDKKANLEELGKLGKIESLNELHIMGIDDSSDFVWMGKLQNLKSIYIRKCEMDNAELLSFQNLSGLNELALYYETGDLSDLSWLENLQMLTSLKLEAQNVTVEDFSLLLELPNLQRVWIGSCSYSRDNPRDEKLNDQFEKMQKENPDKSFAYYRAE